MFQIAGSRPTPRLPSCELVADARKENGLDKYVFLPAFYFILFYMFGQIVQDFWSETSSQASELR